MLSTFPSCSQMPTVFYHSVIHSLASLFVKHVDKNMMLKIHGIKRVYKLQLSMTNNEAQYIRINVEESTRQHLDESQILQGGKKCVMTLRKMNIQYDKVLQKKWSEKMYWNNTLPLQLERGNINMINVLWTVKKTLSNYTLFCWKAFFGLKQFFPTIVSFRCSSANRRSSSLSICSR